MNMKKLSALILVVVMLLGVLAGCKKSTETTNPPAGWIDDGKNYTYNTWTTVSPSNWNELSYQDANDSDLISLLGTGGLSDRDPIFIVMVDDGDLLLDGFSAGTAMLTGSRGGAGRLNRDRP